jgi:hypothetical protein
MFVEKAAETSPGTFFLKHRLEMLFCQLDNPSPMHDGGIVTRTECPD